MDCPFCAIVSGREKSALLYSDEKTLAFLDIYPVSLGHTLVIPKRHIPWLHELPPEEAGPFYRTVWLMSNKLKKAFDCEYVSLLIRGTRIPHLHAHLIPKIKGEENIFDKFLDLHHFIQVRPREIPSFGELLKIAERIRERG